MRIKEIELSEALRIIGEGNPDKNLYVLDGDGYKYKALRDYRAVSIDSHYINCRKWFLKLEGDTE